MLLLTRVLLKNGWGNAKNGRIKNSQLIIAILVAICFLPVIAGIVQFLSSMYDMLSSIGQTGILPGLGLAATAMVIFIFGLFYIINTFYFANDIPNLLPLPLKASEIVGAKFLVVLVYEYVTQAFLLLPLLFTYGVKSHAGPVYYIYSLIIFFTAPIIPLAVASVITLVLMRFTTLGRNQDRFRLLGGIAAIVIGIGTNIAIQNMARQAVDPQKLQSMLLEGNNSLLQLTTATFPTARFAAAALVSYNTLSGLIQLILFLGITLLGYWVFALLSQVFYLRVAAKGMGSSSRGRRLSTEQLGKASMQNSALKAYTLKELRLLFRTPAYLINCILPNFIWPVLILIMIFTPAGGAQSLEPFIKLLAGNADSGGVLAAITAVILFASATNGVACTAISREGEGFYITKYLPVPYHTQILAKVLSGIAVSLLGLFAVMVPLFPILQVPPVFILPCTVLGLAAILFSSLSGILLDLVNPKLHWDNEQKAVKQNLNILFSMLVSIAAAGGMVYMTIRLGWDRNTAFLLLLALFAILDGALYWAVVKKGPGLYAGIEK